MPELLCAGHIKPRADCDTNAERLDIFNGLLLAPHLDEAFDSGFVTIADGGSVLFSDGLSRKARSTLGIDGSLKVRGLHRDTSGTRRGTGTGSSALVWRPRAGRDVLHSWWLAHGKFRSAGAALQAPSVQEVASTVPPFGWDPEHRFQLKYEIDAAFFHLYGISREDADCVLETVQVLKRSEKRQYGECRTIRAVLETYDALAAADGMPCHSPLGPPRRAT